MMQIIDVRAISPSPPDILKNKSKKLQKSQPTNDQYALAPSVLMPVKKCKPKHTTTHVSVGVCVIMICDFMCLFN